jgi:hypothetical protein
VQAVFILLQEKTMADRSKFEEMLELLVNEDKERAQELFHEIVVEKSRDIYESLLEDEEVEESDEEVDEAADEEVDESEEELDEADEEVDESDDELEEGFDLDEFEVEADPMMMGGDPADELSDLDGDDEAGDDMDMDMGDEGDMADRVEDLEDELEKLKAEFDSMMNDDDAGDEEEAGDDMDMDMDDEEPEEEGYAFEAADEEVEEAADEDLEEGKMKDSLIGDSEKMSKAEFAKKHGKEAADEHYESAKTAGEQMREYVEKVAPAKHGDNGVNTKSSVAGKNDMGGTTANILRADTEESGEAGAGTTIKGNPVQKQAPAAMNTKNINVPGGKAGKTSFKKKEPGHGAETRGKSETADKAAGSTLNKLSKRAK